MAGVLFTTIGTATALAQSIPVASATPDHHVSAPARVTIDVDGAPLLAVVSLVARQAGLRPAYNESILPSGVRVTLHVRDLAVEDAFQQVLSGTGLVAQIRPVGTVVIARAGDEEAQRGGITVIVTDAATKQPISRATVTVDSGRPSKTQDNGTLVISGISAGVHKMTVRAIGYRVYSMPVTIRDGATERLAITLTPSATALSEVVTTATGDRPRYETGNAIGTIHADSIVPTTLIRNMSDLLQARVPGVVVENTSGDVGAPSKIRLRGVNSLALNNDPIIILDGVRLQAQTTAASLQTNVGSAKMLSQLSNPANGNATPPLAPSRLDDIDPNTIESIDVLRGPSASSLYGTDAANGVIVIKTKRGQPGSWRSTITGNLGTSSVPGSMPAMWWGWSYYQTGLSTTECNLAVGGFATVAGGGCIQDSVTQFNPQNNPAMRTTGTGTSKSLTADLSGGTASLIQYFSGTLSSDVGLAKMSDAEARLIGRLWATPVPSWMIHPNTQQEVDGTSTTTITINPKADVSLHSSAIYRNVLNGVVGDPPGTIPGYGASAADTLSYLPSEGQRTKNTETAKHGTIGGTGNYRPLRWLSFVANLGGDYIQDLQDADLRAQDCSLALFVANGTTACPSGHTSAHNETFTPSADIRGTLSFTPWSWLSLQTSTGEQYSRTYFSGLQVGNSNPQTCPLAYGTTLLSPNPVCTNSSAQQYAVTESRDEAATAGIYLEETVGLFGVYNTFGIRRDVASAFGREIKTESPPYYPKLDLSYPISDKSFFPKQPYISSLRLRLAYGQSGNQASQTAVLNNYSVSQVTYGGTTSATNSVLVTQLGNPFLKPEKTTEWEGGVDVSFFENERVHAEVTMYRKFTHDAIISLPLAPSYGQDNLSQYVNLGNVENRGLEVSLTTKLLDTRAVNWDLVLNGTKNTNKLVHKSPLLNVAGPLNTQFREGYPLYGYWGAPVESYADANGDGFLEQNEIKFGSQEYLGAPYPKGEVTYASNLGLWNGAIRIHANLDQILGQTTQLLVGNSGNYHPRAAVDRTAPLAQQAAYIQAVVNNNAYIGTSSSVRLNELSVTYTVPAATARRLLRVSSLAVTLAGRNLALWTNYAGKDPNVDTSGLFGEATQDNSLGTPQPREWALRFTLGL